MTNDRLGEHPTQDLLILRYLSPVEILQEGLNRRWGEE